MKSQRHVRSGAFVVAFLVFCGLAPNAWCGWYKTKWGMTIDEIKAALTEKVTDLNTAKGETPHYVIDDFKWGKYTFRVQLRFDAKKRLDQVALRLKGDQDKAACFSDIENDLKKQYGAPTVSKQGAYRGTASETQARMRQWVSPDTVVEMIYYGRSTGASNEMFSLVFQNRKTAEL